MPHSAQYTASFAQSVFTQIIQTGSVCWAHLIKRCVMVRLFSFFRAASVDCVGSDPQAVFIPHGGAARRGGPSQGAAGWALGAVVVAAVRRGLVGVGLVGLCPGVLFGSWARGR